MDSSGLPHRPHILRVALVAPASLLRDGLALMLRKEGDLEFVACAASSEPLFALHDVPDVVVVHLSNVDDLARDVAALRAHDASTRIVALHDELTVTEMRTAYEAGVSLLVDARSSTVLLMEAVRGSRNRSLRRWARPRIGMRPLTGREQTVLELVASGMTAKDIAAALSISHHTVENHKQRIFRRLAVHNQAQAVSVAVQFGLIDPLERAHQ